MKVVRVAPRGGLETVGTCEVDEDLARSGVVVVERRPRFEVAGGDLKPLPFCLQVAGNPLMRFSSVILTLADGSHEVGIWWEDGGPHPRWLPGWTPIEAEPGRSG